MSTERPSGLSVCVITLNEEARIARCLESVTFADEIVVVDSGSRDKTTTIARRFRARIHKRKFDGFINQKNFAIEKARRKWVLILDADEVVTPQLRADITRIITEHEGDSPPPHVAYRMARMSFYLGQWIRHCGWYPEYKIRLFRNGYARYTGDTIHEKLAPDGSIGLMKSHLEHYSYATISDHLKRIDAYSTLIARDKFGRGRKSSVLWAITKAFSKFVITYFYHRGFLDGKAGLVVSVLAGYYNFLKYIKLWELHRMGEKRERDVHQK